MASSYALSIGADSQGNNVITVAEFSFGLLLASLDLFFAATKDFLGTSLCVEDDSKRSCHVYALLVEIVVQVLSTKIALVAMDEFNLVGLLRWILIDWRHLIRSLDSAEPRLASHELVTKLRWFSIELIVARQAIALIVISVGLLVLMLLLELALFLAEEAILERLELRHEGPFFVLTLFSSRGCRGRCRLARPA